MRPAGAAHPRGEEPGAALFCGLGGPNVGGPLAMRTLRYLLRQHLDMAGIVDGRKTGHSLRHTVVTNLLRQGVAPVRVMSVTRHRSLATLQVYAHDLEREEHPAEEMVRYGRDQGH